MAKKRNAQRNAKTILRLLHILGVIALIFGVSVLVYQERTTSVFINATTQQPQPYTELYFTNSTHLPATARAGQTVPVQFTIHNVEARKETYTYRIDLTVNGHTTAVRQQQAILADGHTTTVADTIKLPANYSGRVEIGVALLQHPENIHYWVEIN